MGPLKYWFFLGLGHPSPVAIDDPQLNAPRKCIKKISRHRWRAARARSDGVGPIDDWSADGLVSGWREAEMLSALWQSSGRERRICADGRPPRRCGRRAPGLGRPNRRQLLDLKPRESVRTSIGRPRWIGGTNITFRDATPCRVH